MHAAQNTITSYTSLICQLCTFLLLSIIFSFDTGRLTVSEKDVIIFLAVCGGVGFCVLVFIPGVLLVCLLIRKKLRNRNWNIGLLNAQPPSTRIMPPPELGLIAEPQPEHTGSEGSNLSPSHQPSYGACTPTTPYTTATVEPPPYSSGGYTGTSTSAVSPL